MAKQQQPFGMDLKPLPLSNRINRSQRNANKRQLMVGRTASLFHFKIGQVITLGAGTPPRYDPFRRAPFDNV